MIQKINKKPQKLFPPELISGSVSTQKELDDAFLKYPNYARNYVQIAVHWKNARQTYERYWGKAYKYLDKNFLINFQTEKEHQARAWELYLAGVLLENGLKLKEKTQKAGPDFCVELSKNKNIWIEATICTRGDKDPVEPYPELQPGKVYLFGGDIEKTHRPRVLRITNAIESKLEKIKKYIANPQKISMQKDDCILIAINGDAIQHFADSHALLKRAVFGQGPSIFIRKNDKLIGGFYQPKLTTTKLAEQNTKEIPSNFMETSEFSEISAILYCGHNLTYSLENNKKVEDEFLFAYHTKPKNAVPTSFFKFGYKIKKDTKTGSISDQKQK